MDFLEYRKIRDRFDYLVEQSRDAQRYFRRYGQEMQTETAHRYRMILAEARKELPDLTQKLLDSWK